MIYCFIYKYYLESRNHVGGGGTAVGVLCAQTNEHIKRWTA